jgi:hypothetical protein
MRKRLITPKPQDSSSPNEDWPDLQCAAVVEANKLAPQLSWFFVSSSSGSTHLWYLRDTKPTTDWRAQIDQLMQKQMIALNHSWRKRHYDEASK